MKRFNPDRELRKIQHGSRNRIIFCMLFGIVLLTIGYSFALYQVRYSKRIIYTKVTPFSIRDIKLAVKVEGEEGSRKEFPNKNEGLVFSRVECDTPEITTATWNWDNWSLVVDTKGPNKCTVYFKEMTKLTTYLANLTNDPRFIIDESGDNNKRYIGADPNNYIWFNCDDYTKVTDAESAKTQNCEKWRIIGLFKNIEKADGNKEDLVKIVRSESIGDYSWDNKDTTTGAEDNSGKNDWSTAELMYLLNPNNSEHKLNGVIANNSLYWNSESGKCSNDWRNTTTACDFRSTGLKGNDSGPTKSMIESVKWNLGGSQSGTVKEEYTAERGTTVYPGRPTTWDGKVGLIYPSDYGYATAGGTSKTRQDCLDFGSDSWYTGEYQTDCAENDWLKISKIDGVRYWALTPSFKESYAVGTVSNSGNTGFFRMLYISYKVHPSLYLSSKVGIKEGTGDGSSNNPYVLLP